MTHDLTYIETYRRLTDNRLVIIGMHKKPIEAFVDFQIHDLGQQVGIGDANPSGVAYLMYYTTVEDEYGYSGPFWTERAKQELEKLGLDLEEIYWLCVWGEGRWAQDYNDGLEIDLDQLGNFNARFPYLSELRAASDNRGSSPNDCASE